MEWPIVYALVYEGVEFENVLDSVFLSLEAAEARLKECQKIHDLTRLVQWDGLAGKPIREIDKVEYEKGR